jgi:hypothetical protein
MFFSSKDFYEAVRTNVAGCRSDVAEFCGLTYSSMPSRQQVRMYVRAAKQAILDRRTRISGDEEIYLGKWFRPWDIVPALRDYTAPDGEFAVGVEIEMGFNSLEASRNIARTVQHWKHIALDYEGGNFPIEATFPPVLYSKYNGQSQPSRYLKLLALASSGVAPHLPHSWVGTHINVSKGGSRVPDYRNRLMYSHLEGLSSAAKVKYFGRGSPYNYNINQNGKYIEFKMFNSTTDWKQLRRYVDVAVALADLLYSEQEITAARIREALEIGYNKRNPKVPA